MPEPAGGPLTKMGLAESLFRVRLGVYERLQVVSHNLASFATVGSKLAGGIIVIDAAKPERARP
jgi:hypothetical protein